MGEKEGQRHSIASGFWEQMPASLVYTLDGFRY
jgi:hypothetical protein